MDTFKIAKYILTNFLKIKVCMFINLSEIIFYYIHLTIAIMIKYRKI